MPAASAATRIDIEPELLAEDVGRRIPPASERARYTPRFRVVTRRPMVAEPRGDGGGSLSHSLFVAAVPVLCLLVYVLFWTMTMRGSYYREQLQGEIRTLRLEQAELEAEKRRLQSPALIFQRAARELGMQSAQQREFAQLPATALTRPAGP